MPRFAGLRAAPATAFAVGVPGKASTAYWGIPKKAIIFVFGVVCAIFFVKRLAIAEPLCFRLFSGRRRISKYWRVYRVTDGKRWKVGRE
jgi:hypothetical protein